MIANFFYLSIVTGSCTSESDAREDATRHDGGLQEQNMSLHDRTDACRRWPRGLRARMEFRASPAPCHCGGPAGWYAESMVSASLLDSDVVMDNAKNDLRSLGFAENAIATNAIEIAKTFALYYGEAASDRLHSLMTKHYGAVKPYSLAIVAGNKQQQKSAMAECSSSTDEIATFLNGISPYLSRDGVRDLFGTHVDHHVVQIDRLQARDYIGEEDIWQMMEHHIYVIPDTLSTALVKQFPTRFT